MGDKVNELDQAKGEYLTKLKQVELAKAGIDIDQVDEYVMFIDAESEEEITKQAKQVAEDSKGEKKVETKINKKKNTWRPF